MDTTRTLTVTSTQARVGAFERALLAYSRGMIDAINKREAPTPSFKVTGVVVGVERSMFMSRARYQVEVTSSSSRLANAAASDLLNIANSIV